jgi:hydrogenase nickel insertion protein HypA
MPVTGRTLVAGVGNVFLRDDAFGVEVVRLLAQRPRPDGVEIADFGIRGVHLVYELLNGCDLFVLIDAAQRGYEPGTVTVLEVEPADAVPAAPVMDAHDLTPDAIFAMLTSMGGHPGRSLVVACEPADLGAGMGLSDPVRAALPHAVSAVEEILGQRQKESEPNAEQDSHGGGNRGDSVRSDRFAAGRQALPGNQEDVDGSDVHEFGLCEGVLQAVQTRAAGRPVAGIRVRCGVRHAVDPQSLAQAFALVADGTEAAGAAVEVVTVPATVTCRDCGTAGESTDQLAVCPRCGGANVEVSGGDELVLESVRYAASR